MSVGGDCTGCHSHIYPQKVNEGGVVAKKRLDEILVNRKLVETRSKARALIMAGDVLVENTPANKAGTPVSPDACIRIREKMRYVSRGGIKLEAAFKAFRVCAEEKTCLDVGASTGGFSDCLLQHGAKKIWAIDVGKNQLHWKLQTDARVTSLEGENFRHFDPELITDGIDLAVMDVSFISVKLLIPKVLAVFGKSPGEKQLVILIKPQFEVGRSLVEKGGLVKNKAAREEVVNGIVTFCSDHRLENIRVIPSPITGRDGNVEYLLSANFKTQT